MRIPSSATAALATCLLLVSGSVSAQEDAPGASRSPLQAAEAAYMNVDFEAVRDHALESLRRGGLTPEQLVRTYELLGVAHSALRETDAARDYFVRMLGVAPDHELDASVNPQMRDPFLEARGLWAARTDRLSVEVGLNRPASSLRVVLSDPTEMATRIRISARLEGEAQFTTAEYESVATLNAPVVGAADADRVEYYVEVLDIHGNIMIAQGSAFDPRVIGRMQLQAGEDGESFFDGPAFWLILAAVAVVAGGITAGVIVDQRSRIGVQTGISFGVD